MNLRNYFKEGTAESFARLSSGVLIGVGCLIAIAEVTYCFFVNTYQIHTGLILELITIGMLGKASGKYFETKNGKDETGE